MEVAGGADFHSTGGEHGEDGEDDELNHAAPSTCPFLNPCHTSQVARVARNTTLSPATTRRVVAHACRDLPARGVREGARRRVHGPSTGPQ
jgi:hypothetical protein